MNEMRVARGLGWFSIGLGLAELVAGREMGRMLGMEGRSGLIRLYGLREIAAGVGIFSKDNPAPWMWARVAGDVLDLATLATAYTDDNPRRDNVAVAIGSVAGIAALDYWCAKRLHSGRPHGSWKTHLENVADGPSIRDSSGNLPASSR